MTPFHFGPAEEPLFGMYAAPRASDAREAGVLVCAPIGLEYLRTHYALRLLAQQLAERGFHVLRFDYHGTGDSGGEIGAGQFDRWLDDIVLAMQELAELSGSDTPTVVGLRMGAVLALEAAVQREKKLQGVVLWDPVVDGPEYFAVLKRIQEELASLRPAPPRPTDELLGTVYPSDLRRVLGEIDMTKLIASLDARKTALVVSEDLPEYRVLLEGMRVRWPDAAYRPMADPADWKSLKAAFDARMTGPIVRAVAEAAESVS